jgi:two-component system chemotaxis sensor kinase CheA
VIVTVHDDGRGLNPARILAKAQALGLNVGATESEEIFALAFLPGLSTAERVSSLAGRGVGLDVVAGAVRALGGTVSLTSESGRGTTFTLVLPLTVLVLRALIVDVAGERYAIALHDVAETVRLGPDALHAIDGRGMMLWRNQLIPVSDAGELLGHGSGRRSARPYCVVVQSSAKRHGVLVDRLLGRHDVVAKGLDSSLGRPPLVSGATILGDGRVACILDTVGLVEQFHESAVASGDGGRS